jgi:radical SAM superfamily enzyme YgiQ (UPF0313 family)
VSVFHVDCTKCGNRKTIKHPTRATLTCQSCGSVVGKISFPEDVFENTICLKCHKCDTGFIVKAGIESAFQCPSFKCGGFLLESTEFLTLSTIQDQKVIDDPKYSTDYFKLGKVARPIPPSGYTDIKFRAKESTIKIAVPYFYDGPRINRAVESWIYPDTVFVLTDMGTIPPGSGVCHQLFTDKSSKSEGLNKKTQPYLIDILSKLVEMFPDEEYYGYFNSDVILSPGTSIASLLPYDGKRIVFHHRMECEGIPKDPIYKLKKKYQAFCGKDGFVGDAAAIKDIIKNVADLLIGGAAWDDGLTVWCFKRFNRNKVELRYGDILHALHNQTWTADDKETRFNRRQLGISGIKEKERLDYNWFKESDSVVDPLAKRQKVLGIIQPGRIGDIIIVLPIAKWYSDLGYKVVWPVISEYIEMFNYVNYVSPVDLGPGLASSYNKSIKALTDLGIDSILDLGIGFGRNEASWKESRLSFDEWKYLEAQVPFEERFNLQINRKFDKELDLLNRLSIKKDYVVVHSDASKGSFNFKVKDPIEIIPIDGFTIFDWIGVIEKSSHVYCVDSCVANLVNQLGLAVGRRTFQALDEYNGPRHALIPKINWIDETKLVLRKRKIKSRDTNSVLLVSLPGFHTKDEPLYPLGIGYLVASVQRDRDVQSVHFQRHEHAQDLLPEILSKSKPGIVGFTCTTFNRGSVRKAINKVREILPDSKVVLGGSHPTFLPHQMLKNYGADYVVMGEGENSFRQLCNAIDGETVLRGVDGIAYLDERGEIEITPAVEVEKNLDVLPFPDYGYAEGLVRSSRMGSIIGSRGCPARCKYCSTSHYWGQGVRVHSVERVLNDIERLIDLYGIEKLFFNDDTFNLSEKRVKEICKGMIDRKFKLKWAVSGRVHPVSQEMIDALVEAGCSHICWGIESGSETMLHAMNKKVNLDQIKRAYDLCLKHKNVLSTGAFTLVGYPGETEKTIKETQDFLNTISLTDSPSTAVLYVLPGTEVYEKLKDKIGEDFWVKSDEMFYNTTEHNHMILNKWAYIVSNSGNRIPFDTSKHFWKNILFGNIPVPMLPRVAIRRKSELPLHFFTIVLNGMPFIKYHIKMLQSLPFDWTWHIVEGVAELNHDTGWSVITGGQVVDSFHRNGLSKDGTSEYLDSLEKEFPNKVFIYRKKEGLFWDGKVEMVNAPIENLPDKCLLWEVDVDELWDVTGISNMVRMFEENPDKWGAFVYCYYFVGPKKFITTMDTWSTRPEDWLRVFRFHKGFRWAKHEPPTLVDGNGIDLARRKNLTRDKTLKRNVTFQHFAYALPEQVLFKETYYGYKDALECWKKLQQANGEVVDVGQFLYWAQYGAKVRDWDVNKDGKLLYPGNWA